MTLRVAEDSGVAVVDAQRIMHNRIAADGTRLFQEYSHFTDAGATLMASLVNDAVRGELRARNVPLCAATPAVVAAGATSMEGTPR